ncbi:DNA topoisomerase 2-associated protein pat1 [Malassezia vespertilionis]|uniref:mRNA decay factor PAT1 domain-containing protein n=1 Tax=Malassezia vespertilionis TaxID=2020962 RepID=A0A2N1JDD8_9BASI|nr:DNA topoisomerase 2-associated protein pat1 [Malassezia vespertilionis]PKI84557.1 hypothetical protein MVES_001589 [Malassezia vespertilionis]WFD06343.1 DNA topoisomerase 2-associated protein pat1 [Malassezia vespertilionis]
MSFFGFDTSLPPDAKSARTESDEESALNEKIQRALTASAQEDVEVYTWGESNCDGLGDKLDEANDDFNEDTFGTFAENVSRDFDFGTGAAPTTQKSDKNASAFAASFDDFWSTPSLPVPHSAQPLPKQPGAVRARTLEEIEAELRSKRPANPPPTSAWTQPTQPPNRAMTLEQVEAQLRAQRAHKMPSASQHPHTKQDPPQAPMPPPSSQERPRESPVPAPAANQATHLTHMRALLEACPPSFQSIILALPPPIQFDSLEEFAQRFPNVLRVPGALPLDAKDEQAAIQYLTSQATPRMQAWQAAEEKQRLKAAKLANITRHNGLMSGADKDFITRIQISHLVSPDPYTDDFYAHVFFAVRGGGRNVVLPDANTEEVIEQHKKGDEKRSSRRKLTRHENAMLRMQQQVERLVDSRKKREARGSTLEGALGRVSLVTANKPRQMLQLINDSDAVKQAHTESKPGDAEDAVRAALQGAHLNDAAVRSDAQKRAALTQRETLVILERLYHTVLALEQLRRNPAAEHDYEIVQQQQQLTEKLWTELHVLDPLDISDPHPFVSLLNHVKGKRLLPRALRLLSPEQALTTLTMLIASFQSLDVVRDAALLEQYRAAQLVQQRSNLTVQQALDIQRSIAAFSQSVLYNMINLITDAPLRIVTGMLALLMERNDVLFCAKTKLGTSLLTVLLSRAEALRQAASAAVASDNVPSADELDQWASVFGVLLNRLSANDQLPALFPSTRIKMHLPFGVDLYMAGAFNIPLPGADKQFNLDTEDEPVWNLTALFAIHSNLHQQQVLVQELRDKILSNILAANEARAKGLVADADMRVSNVNLLLHALNLDAAQITL